MLIETIKPGDKVEITLSLEKEDYNTYKSQVESILKDSRVILVVPIYYGKLVKLKLGSGYNLLFFTKFGMILFQGKIEKYVKQGDFYFMIVKLESEGEKVQRREFFRFPCIMPMKFSSIRTSDNITQAEAAYAENIFDEDMLEDEEEYEEVEIEARTVIHLKDGAFYDGIIKDISGGGVKFVTNVKIEDKTMLRCILLLDGECLVTIAKVLDSIYLPKLKYNYQYRCVFIGILPTEQDRIVQYIYNAQRKKLQVAPKKYLGLDNYYDYKEKS